VRRRTLLAGVASVGALGGAGLVASGNTPDGLGFGDSSEPVEPTTLPTVEAPGSRDGEVTLPADGRATFVDFFGTWCPPCAEQMPALVEAHDRLGDEVQFVSVTTEDVGDAVSEETVADWWREHDGDWLVAADVSAELFTRLSVNGFPSARAIDATGRVRWATSGTHTTEEFVEGIRRALDR
jgi:thiol-disulfide isomerase/thioredoxin